jgi:hypothetical protein
MASAEETVMPNAVETGRQHVEENPADEFRRSERHRLRRVRGAAR